MSLSEAERWRLVQRMERIREEIGETPSALQREVLRREYRGLSRRLEDGRRG